MIYQHRCPYCGNEYKTDKEDQIFCSKHCSNKGRQLYDRGDFDISLDWKRSSEDGKWFCPYQNYVSCTVRKCTTCGWNPIVAKARLNKIMGVDNA